MNFHSWGRTHIISLLVFLFISLYTNAQNFNFKIEDYAITKPIISNLLAILDMTSHTLDTIAFNIYKNCSYGYLSKV